MKRTHCDICGMLIPKDAPNSVVTLDWNGLSVGLFVKPIENSDDICVECLRKAAAHGRIVPNQLDDVTA